MRIKKVWGENTSTKNTLKRRNIEIFNRYEEGISIKKTCTAVLSY